MTAPEPVGAKRATLEGRGGLRDPVEREEPWVRALALLPEELILSLSSYIMTYMITQHYLIIILNGAHLIRVMGVVSSGSIHSIESSCQLTHARRWKATFG